MSLKIDQNTIAIQNVNGVEKFNSNHKLLYKASVVSGSLELGNRGGFILTQARVDMPTQFIAGKGFILVSVSIVSTDGNQAGDLIGDTVNLSAPLYLDLSFTPTTRSYQLLAAESYTTLAGTPQVLFTTYGWERRNGQQYPVTSTRKNVQFNYRITHLAYR